MLQIQQRRRDDEVRELGRRFEAADAAARERDAAKAAQAEAEGKNVGYAMSRRARTLEAARKLVRARTPPPPER